MVKLYESGENYLEVILDIEREQGHVRSIEIARRVGVSRASVSKALGVLREAGLVEPSFYGAVVLTKEGLKRAQDIRARHDLLYCFLHDGLQIEKEIAERDACRMEHVVSGDMLNHVVQWLHKNDIEKGNTECRTAEPDHESNRR